jgi:hypothetical protein
MFRTAQLSNLNDYEFPLQYYVYKYNLSDLFQEIFEIQRKDSVLKNIDNEIDEVFILYSDTFYIGKKFIDYENIDLDYENIDLLNLRFLKEYNLEALFDTPIFFMQDCCIKKMLRNLLKEYNFEHLLIDEICDPVDSDSKENLVKEFPWL